ncbi:MAG TPA: Hsp70 family protein, partial [Labilithrix sp.]|nr:Hsp70 family protein [Labilithrix sp.]
AISSPLLYGSALPPRGTAISAEVRRPIRLAPSAKSILVCAAPLRSVGLDFGTTNSAIGVVENGTVKLARFAHAQGFADTFRSILYFHPDARDKYGRYEAVGGPRAIDRYLEAEGKGRLIQSLKSYVADRGFQATSIFSRTHSLIELLTLLLVDLRARAEEELGPLGHRIVVGRPVHFAHASAPEDEAFALERLTAALAKAGWTDVVFEHEPVGAAYYYEKQLTKDELVLIADFGGGTSDFTLMDIGPSRAKREDGGAGAILGTDGVGIAGDALDAKVLHNVVAPMLGLGSTYRAMFGRELEVPVWIYSKLRRWHHLSFLKTKKNLELIEEIAAQSDESEKIRALLHILDNDLGYHLYRAVERAKVELSTKEETTFSFSDPPLEIEARITRADFDSWISDETTAMAECVDRLLAKTGIPASSVDRVFMTGGTSFVPAVRRIFDERFGREKIRAGGEMISVATGLALRACEA